jgi:putative NIF3 family GTP cyclohydrolase 1 type 2
MRENYQSLTRRAFGLGVASGAVALGLPALATTQSLPTVDEVLKHIRAGCVAQGITWSEHTVDTLKAGDPSMPVVAIVATFMATLSLLRAAVDAGANLIVTHEPTFWSHPDTISTWVDDPVYRAKTDYIARNKLAIFRFHDHWHQTKPEPMSAALRARLGWERYLADGGASGFEARYVRTPMPLSALVAELRDRLPSRSVRVIGQPGLSVSRIAFGGHGIDSVVLGLAQSDVLIVPEVREYDSGAYVRDLIESGSPKALIMIAHERAEEYGMTDCAEWLRRQIPGISTRHISSGEPFWQPKAP